LRDPAARYLSPTGVVVEASYYREVFHPDFVSFRQSVLPHSPDDPIILHRRDIVRRRGPFSALRDPVRGQQFDDALVRFLESHEFELFTVVLDKQGHLVRYERPWEPYPYCLTVLLERFRGFLANRGLPSVGDVMAERRGKREDRALAAEYRRLYEGGTRYLAPKKMQAFLSSRELKLKDKSADVCGLQIADLLAHPCKQAVLFEKSATGTVLAGFAQRLWQAVSSKCDRRYGRVLLSSMEEPGSR